SGALGARFSGDDRFLRSLLAGPRRGGRRPILCRDVWLAAGHVRWSPGRTAWKPGRDRHPPAVEHGSKLRRATARGRLRAGDGGRLPGHDEVHLRGAPEAVLAVPTLALPEIRATSPTLAETMRSCLMRAGLSRASGSSSFVLGNPKAWLGTAYHEVLEK